jgi:hypothetical protein
VDCQSNYKNVSIYKARLNVRNDSRGCTVIYSIELKDKKMLKKMILVLLLVGFTGILVWGGINRTLAKSNDSYDVEELRGQQNRQSNTKQDNHEENIDLNQKGSNEALYDYGIDNKSQLTEGRAADFSQDHGGGYRGGRNGDSSRRGQGGSSEPLDEQEIEALHMALNDEYHALAVYQSVMATFGQVDPFVEITQSEQRHIDALVNQFEKYDILVSGNPWIGNIPAFESVEQACQAGVEAEIENAALYDMLFSMTDKPTLIQVFSNLRRASFESHLPQFEACQ